MWRSVGFWVGGGALIVALAFASVKLGAPGTTVALWWPAAGVSAVLALRAPAAQRPFAIALVFVATTLGNLVAGRPLELSPAFGAANAIEVAFLAWLLLRGRDDARLRTTTDAVRFIACSAVSAATLGLAVAAINTVSGSGDALSSALITGASHLSAVLLILPLALFDPQPQPRPRTGELVCQLSTMVMVLAAGLGPLTDLPLAFLVFVPLAWATLRFPPMLAHLEALAVAVTVVLFSRLGGGAFTSSGLAPTELSITATVFLAAIAIFTILISTERNESVVNARVAVDAAEKIATAARATTAAMQVRYDLERQRQDFLSTTSHELRTPVTIIAGYSELLSEMALPGDATSWVGAINRNTSRLASMLDDLLSFSLAQAERPQPVSVSVTDLVTSVVSRHADEATARDLRVTVESSDDLRILADSSDAARALGSLCSNAVKFTSTSGRIHVEATGVAADVMISVSDTGPGLSPDALAQVFDPFYRGEQAEKHATPGTGLGMPIARMLARRNGGEVTIVSFEDRGTKATLLLPRSTDAFPAEELTVGPHPAE